MKKSLMAISMVLSLVLGLCSCSKNDTTPEPEPEQTQKTVFSNKICFCKVIVEYYDINIEFTDPNGKTTTTNVKDCPIEKVPLKYTDMETAEEVSKELDMYVFTKKDEIVKKPVETTMKVIYTCKGKVPPTGQLERLHLKYDCSVQYGDKAAVPLTWVYTDTPLDYEIYPEFLNNNLGKFVLKVNENGIASATLEQKKY